MHVKTCIELSQGVSATKQIAPPECCLNRCFKTGSRRSRHDCVHEADDDHPPETKEESVMHFKRLVLAAVLGLSAATAISASASAQTYWQHRHPGRAEVNVRLADLNRRIGVERREGDISGREARYLHHEDRFIRAQERFDARFDHGRLTRAEFRSLNQEENGLSRQIGR
jgi:hypothetical protein